MSGSVASGTPCRRIHTDIIINVHRSSCTSKLNFILVRFYNETRISPTNGRKPFKYQCAMKIGPVGTEVLHANGHT
jgi:hypothetical protein